MIFTLKMIKQRDVNFNEFNSEQFGKTLQCSEWGAERFIVRRTNRAGEAGGVRTASLASTARTLQAWLARGVQLEVEIY